MSSTSTTSNAPPAAPNGPQEWNASGMPSPLVLKLPAITEDQHTSFGTREESIPEEFHPFVEDLCRLTVSGRKRVNRLP
uniref:Uncharacterized protein n=1 Tax=Ditylenchus dipsaci TaxID=166011 RepID=A0A915DVB7_9BILA